VQKGLKEELCGAGLEILLFLWYNREKLYKKLLLNFNVKELNM
jgi:hypothetical protein